MGLILRTSVMRKLHFLAALGGITDNDHFLITFVGDGSHVDPAVGKLDQFILIVLRDRFVRLQYGLDHIVRLGSRSHRHQVGTDVRPDGADGVATEAGEFLASKDLFAAYRVAVLVHRGSECFSVFLDEESGK